MAQFMVDPFTASAGQSGRDGAIAAGQDETWRDTPLVPAVTIAGRALVTVIAIMTFLASLTAGFAVVTGQASESWRNSVSMEMTVQVKPLSGRDIEADVAKAAAVVQNFPGVDGVRIYSKAESERLLEPWLGAGLDLGELPVPRMIVVRLAKSQSLDAPALAHALASETPNAFLDDHGVWLKRLALMARVVVGAALAVFVLVLIAMGLAVVFATRGAMAGNKEIIDVLHFVGATDAFISRQFQRHFLRLGLRGGLVGGGACIVLFLALGAVTRHLTASAAGEQVEAMFGAFSLGLKGYGLITLIAFGVAGLTGFMSRAIVFRQLRRLR